MKKLLFNSLLVMMSACMLSLIGCQKPEDVTEPEVKKTLELTSSTSNVSGEGDAFVLTIKSNLKWELSVVDADGKSVDWVRLDKTSGEGNAEVRGTVLAGDRNATRTCTIVLSAKDSDLKKNLKLTQGVFTPEVIEMLFTDIIKIGNRIEVAASENLVDFGQFNAEVIGAGDNVPEGYIYVTNGEYFLRVKTPHASTASVGDNLLLDTTGGKLTKDNAGVYTVELPAEFLEKKSGEPTVEPLYISADVIGRYENALVAIAYSRPQEGALGGSWSGDVAMTTKVIPTGADYTVHVNESASFASGTIPSATGQVVGVVIDGKVCPRSADDLAGLSEPLEPIFNSYTITPIGNYFKCSGNNTFSNGTVTNKRKFTFTDEPGFSVAGASIEKIGGTDAQTNLTIVVGQGTPYQTCFVTKGWTIDGSYLLYTIPVNQNIYGHLEFSFSVSTGTLNAFKGDFTVQWSKDKENWSDVDAVYSTANVNAETARGNKFTLTKMAHNANRQVAEFYIPEDEAISSGNIYMKVATKATSDVTLRVNVGFTLSTKVFSPQDYGFENVLAMENFETAVFGHNTVVGIPVYYMMNHFDGPVYSSAEWAAEKGNGGAVLYRGFMHLSRANGPLYMKSPVLSELNPDIPTDIYVTFKVAPSWMDTSDGTKHEKSNANIQVTVEGSGTVGDIVWDEPFPNRDYGWHTATVKITGASSDTCVLIGDMVCNPVSRFFIDDIIISK